MNRADEKEPRRGLGPRFGPETALILAAAAFAALLELSWLGVVAVVFAAWLAVAAFEILRARARPAGTGDEDPAPPPAEPEPDPAPQERELAAEEVVAPAATRPDEPPPVDLEPEREPPRVEQQS